MKKKLFPRALTAAIVIVATLGMVRAVPASAATQSDVLEPFHFNALDYSTLLFDSTKLDAAAKKVNDYMATAKSSPGGGSYTFGTNGYSDKRCTASNYPGIPSPCLIRTINGVAGVTWANYYLSQQRATTLRDQVLARLQKNYKISNAKKAALEKAWDITAYGESTALARISDCRANENINPCLADRHADVVLIVTTPDPTPSTTTIPKPPVPVAPTASPDTFPFEYGTTYRGDVSDGDVCSATPCTYAITKQPSVGFAVISGSIVTFKAPEYFTGKVTFEYSITASNKLSDTATDTITVSAPDFPAFQAPVSSVKLTAPVWARLGVNERFSLTSSVTCPSGSTKDPAHPNRCVTDLGVVGSYVEATLTRVTSSQLNPPAGMPASRYGITSNPINKNLPASGTAKFFQATQAGKPFQLVVGYYVELHYVKFKRSPSGYAELPDETGTSWQYQFSSTSTKIGVVGNVAK